MTAPRATLRAGRQPAVHPAIHRRGRQDAPALYAKAWQAMRIMRRFAARDLLTTCEGLGPRQLRHYLDMLRSTGYVRLVRPNRAGVPGSTHVFALVRDTGPLAPVRGPQAGTVLDVNTGRTWGPGGAAVAQAAAAAPANAPQRHRGVVLTEGTGHPDTCTAGVPT